MRNWKRNSLNTDFNGQKGGVSMAEHSGGYHLPVLLEQTMEALQTGITLWLDARSGGRAARLIAGGKKKNTELFRIRCFSGTP